MRSRLLRLTLGALACAVLGAATLFVVRSERQLSIRRSNTRLFDLHAREATDALSELRLAQQAYVAAGQGVGFWMPKVAGTLGPLEKAIAALRESAASASAAAGIDNAMMKLADFSDVDRRVREYLKAGQPLMAGDMIFSEGTEAAAMSARLVEAARLEEHQALEAFDTAGRGREALALAGAAGFLAITVLLLALARAPEPQSAPAAEDPAATPADRSPFAAAVEPARPPQISPVLRAAAEVCTDFACVRDASDLRIALGRAGDVMDASGIIVWLGSSGGADLRPVVTHGYSDQMVSRLPGVPRSANNAAAAAYRTGELQIVLSHPGSAQGAVVAPIRTAEGCVGAMSAEIRDGGEASESTQALAAIVAAQLAGVLAISPAETSSRAAASS